MNCRKARKRSIPFDCKRFAKHDGPCTPYTLPPGGLRMNAVDQHKRAYDDHCPLCGEGITEDDHTLIDEINMWCGVERGSFDVAVLS